MVQYFMLKCCMFRSKQWMTKSEPGGSEPCGTEFFALLAIHYQEGKGASLALWMREQAPSQQFCGGSCMLCLPD